MATSSPFKMGASQMIGGDATKASMDASQVKLPHAAQEGVVKSMAQVSLRQTHAPQHQRPALGNVYSPTPAPGSTISVVRKKILKRQENAARSEQAAESLMESPVAPRVSTAGSNSVRFVDNDRGGDTRPRGLPNGEEDNYGITRGMVGETPRAQWRRQFWQKNTPWGVDRSLFGGGHFYETTIKSSVRNYNNSTRWEHDPKLVPTGNSEDIIRQIVYKLEQHCNTTFALTRAFKIFDRDMSSSIDKDEMRAVLITFSIDLSDEEIDQLMDDFGGRDAGDGLGKTIRYQDFVIAVDTVGSRHPLKINSGRFFTDLKARYLKDTEGRRLCTPGARGPVGCPIGGCYYPNANGLPSRSGRKSAMW